MFKRLFSSSRWIHKYSGLLVLAALAILALSGILLNHPSLLVHWEIPQGFLGESYRYDNWNRFAFRDSLLMADGTILIGGKLGVFIGKPRTGPLEAWNKGLPESAYLRDTHSLLAVNRPQSVRLYAGTRGGLFYRDKKDSEWKEIDIPVQDKYIVDLVHAHNKVLAFTSHDCLMADTGDAQPRFRRVQLPIHSGMQKIPAYLLLGSLHSGARFGFPAKVVVDLVAAALIFLCLSAFYIWLYPKRIQLLRGKKGRWFASFFFRYHLKVGIWASIFLLVIAATGILIRPPLIILVHSLQVPTTWLGKDADKILKAVAVDDSTLIVATRCGWYKGGTDLREPMEPVQPPFPVFGMGPTVLERVSGKTVLAGSFSGLFYWDTTRNSAANLKGEIPKIHSSTRPARGVMATGVLLDHGKLNGYADYRMGMVGKEIDTQVLHSMWPREASSRPMSLYHFLFDLHNGRILRDWIGPWYILLVPLVGMTLIMVTITGIFDWCWRKWPKKPSDKKSP